jgi:hypothetical protein
MPDENILACALTAAFLLYDGWKHHQQLAVRFALRQSILDYDLILPPPDCSLV